MRPYITICYACNQNTLCDEVNQVVPKSLTEGYWIDPADGRALQIMLAIPCDFI